MAKSWLATLVTPLVYRKRGIDPTDEQIVAADAAAQTARDEIKEAADSETGLFELPLRADTSASGVDRGGPFGYAEASPYTWLDVQREAVNS
jgi:guanyl-specific ribonuclease Sa